MMSVCIISGLRKSEETVNKVIKLLFCSIKLFYGLTIELLTYGNNWMIYLTKCGIIINSFLKKLYFLEVTLWAGKTWWVWNYIDTVCYYSRKIMKNTFVEISLKKKKIYIKAILWNDTVCPKRKYHVCCRRSVKYGM
jgi:hypothetical protein